MKAENLHILSGEDGADDGEMNMWSFVEGWRVQCGFVIFQIVANVVRHGRIR